MNRQGKTNYVTQQQLNTIRGGSGSGHFHANKEVLDSITALDLITWTSAAVNSHVHANKEVLDLITQDTLTELGRVSALSHQHGNKDALDLIQYNPLTRTIVIGDSSNPVNFVAYGEVTAYGPGDGGSGGVNYLYQLMDVPDYRTSYRGKYLRAKTDGSGVEWVDVTGGTSAFDDLTGRPKYNGSTMTSSTDIPAVPTALSQLSDDTNHRLVTDSEKTTWNGKQNAITSTSKLSASLVSGLATVATSGAYSDLSGKPTIPTQLPNPYSLTFGSRTYDGSSAKEITKSDLGLGNVENKSSATIRGELTANNVTTALGYTPYNAANIGSASVAYASNAGQLGGLGSGSYAAMTNQNGLNYETNLKGGLYVSYNTSGALSGDKGVINIPTWAYNSATTYYLTQISFGVNDNTPKIRYVNNTGASNFVTVYHSGNLTAATLGALTTSAAASTYLPLTGGTLSKTNSQSPLTISAPSMGNICYIAYNNGATNLGGIGVSNTNTPAFRNTSGTWYNIYHSGNVNRSDTPWTCSTLNAYGNIVATGEVAAYNSSDSRFKNNQSDLCRADDILKALRPMEFDWNFLYQTLGGARKGHDVGFVAQQVQPLIPSAIGEIYGGYLSLDYTRITPYLVAGWQSHEKRIEKLERENAELKNLLSRLRNN